MIRYLKLLSPKFYREQWRIMRATSGFLLGKQAIETLGLDVAAVGQLARSHKMDAFDIGYALAIAQATCMVEGTTATVTAGDKIIGTVDSYGNFKVLE